MTTPGDVVAHGRTSTIFAYGTDAVVKVPRPGVPPHWARVEAELTDRVGRTGLACPEVRGLVEVDGRESIVFGRIDGCSLWDLIMAEPSRLEHWTDLLIDLQRSIHRAGPVPSVPRFENRLLAKIFAAEGLSDRERSEAAGLIAGLGRGATLCHGDLHPANVVVGSDGPVAVDWFDAAIGRAEADMVRTSLLIRPPGRGRSRPGHLPGADPGLLARLHRRYVSEVLAGIDPAPLLIWERLLAAGRLAEHTTTDRADLLALWRSDGGDGADGPPSALGHLLTRH